MPLGNFGTFASVSDECGTHAHTHLHPHTLTHTHGNANQCDSAHLLGQFMQLPLPLPLLVCIVFAAKFITKIKEIVAVVIVA